MKNMSEYVNSTESFSLVPNANLDATGLLFISVAEPEGTETFSRSRNKVSTLASGSGAK